MPITYNFPFCSPLSHLKVCQSCFLFPCVSATSLPFLSRMQKCPFQRANKHVFLFIRFPPSWKKKNVLNYMFAQTHKRGYKTPPLWGIMEKLNAVSGEKLFDFLQFPKNLICDSDNPRFRSYSVSLQWLLSPLTSQQYKGNCSQGLDWPKFDQTQHGSKTTSQKKKQGKKKKTRPILVTFALLYTLSEVLILFRAKQTPWLSGIISNMLQKWQNYLEYVSERFILRSYWEPRLWWITHRTYITK